MFYSNRPGFLSYNRNSSQVGIANSKANEEDLYEFASTEIYDGNIYSEIITVPHQQRACAAEYEECPNIDPVIRAAAAEKAKYSCHFQNTGNDQYSYLNHIGNAEGRNRVYQTLSFNSISPPSHEIKERNAQKQLSSSASGGCCDSTTEL